MLSETSLVTKAWEAREARTGLAELSEGVRRRAAGLRRRRRCQGQDRLWNALWRLAYAHAWRCLRVLRNLRMYWPALGWTRGMAWTLKGSWYGYWRRAWLMGFCLRGCHQRILAESENWVPLSWC